MELVIDIGNSCAKLAVFDNNKIIEVYQDSNKNLRQLENIYRTYNIKKGILSAVVDLDKTINKQIEEAPFEVIRLSHSTPVPIVNEYKSPQTLGMDRLAAIIGAQQIKPQTDILVIDSGTCITYDFIDAKGHYKGGNISPGVEMRLKALNSFTDKLPLIDKEGELLMLGDNTESAIRSGVLLGIEFEMKGYISLLQDKYPGVLVFLTGGNDFSFDTSIKSIIFADKLLVLKGLNRILHYND